MYNQIHNEWAKLLHEEILADKSAWFHPSRDDGIFDQAWQKFMTGNLNPYWFENILATTLEPVERNISLPRCYEFAELVRQSHPQAGVFGKMPLWKVPPGAEILSHVDNYKYHRNIYRNIFSVSDHTDNVEININKKKVSVEQGTLFSFRPASQIHSFSNNSETDWYFLGFDFWDKHSLAELLKVTDVDDALNDPGRLLSYGNKRQKYLSNH
jgi:hypothetical protein